MIVRSNPKFFIPISVGNLFYSKKRIKAINSKFNLLENKTAIVVCDSNRYFGYRASKLTFDEAKRKSSRESNEILTMINKALKADDQSSVAFLMSEIATWTGFRRLGSELYKSINHNLSAQLYFEEQVSAHAQRFYPDDPFYAEKWQKRYVFWETVLSIFMTEISGYSTELYKNGSGMFINYLYDQCSECILETTDQSKLFRRFVSLEGLV